MFKAPFSFDGRIRRIEYFLSGIIGGIVSSIAWALGVGTFVLGAASGSAGGSVFGLLGSMIAFGLLIGLAAMIASRFGSLLAVNKRRWVKAGLHDLNKSGWLILLCCEITFFPFFYCWLTNFCLKLRNCYMASEMINHSSNPHLLRCF